jgi:uncharacterized protein (DUF1499 family)
VRLRPGRWLAAALLLAAATGFVVINTSSHDPARWHVDPATARPGANPNEFFSAPRGATAAPTDAETRLYPESPRALLARFDAIARAQPRTRVVAGDPDSLMITYVQRSRVFGFPDYLTVKAVAVDSNAGEGGTGLIIWSRARYGRGDFGVNQARVEAWLAALDRGG